MIGEHEDSHCGRCKTSTFGPKCNWCSAETTRFSPEQEAQRCEQYHRFRAAGHDHALALLMVDQVVKLARAGRRENEDRVIELVNIARAERREAVKPSAPLFAPMPAAVAA